VDHEAALNAIKEKLGYDVVKEAELTNAVLNDAVLPNSSSKSMPAQFDG
jgi:hypothetical protein